MKHKIFAIAFMLFLSFMCVSNIVSNIDAVIEKFSGENLSFNTAKSAMFFVKDSDALNAPFRKQYIEMNGLFHKISGKKYVHDAFDNSVTRLNNGYLAFASLEEKELDTEKATNYITEFNEFAKEEEIDFLYVSVPNKMYKNNPFALSGVYPQYGDAGNFLSSIEKNGVDCINVAKEFQTAGIDMYDFYFKTDHHWKPEGAFFAFTAICEFLKTNYGYEIDSKVSDINEYTFKTYENYLLGSEGSRVGELYAGKDDFSLIYPKFSTHLSIQDKYVSKEGSFYETMFFIESEEDTLTYGTYLGADTPFKVIKNFNAVSDKKIMLVRDSFGSALAPFLSLACSELYVVDMRFENTDANIMDYAKDLDIDTVIVLYSNNTIMDIDLVLDLNK